MASTSRIHKARRNEARRQATEARPVAAPVHEDAVSRDATEGLRARIEGRRIARPATAQAGR
jgi:hypothetical protein